MDDELMTPDEVCAYLKINKDWLYDQVEARRIPHIRLGRQLRFRRTELNDFLDSRTETTHRRSPNQVPMAPDATVGDQLP